MLCNLKEFVYDLLAALLQALQPTTNGTAGVAAFVERNSGYKDAKWSRFFCRSPHSHPHGQHMVVIAVAGWQDWVLSG